MKILFVRPRPSSRTIGLQHVMIVEPLELEVMAALAKPEDTVRIVDMILEKEPVEHFIRAFQPDVFCTTGYITHLPVMAEYARKAKEICPAVITVAGGVHLEKFPGDIDSTWIDYRVVRNATRTFPALLAFLKNGGELPAGVLARDEEAGRRPLPDYDFYFPLPRRELTERYRKNYFYVFQDRVALMKTSFGCPYKCSFCFCRFITDDHYYARPLEEVIEELKLIKEKEVYIVDDDFLLSPTRVEQFITLLKKNNIQKRFLVYGRADFIIENPELIRSFQQAGLRTVIVGLESFKDKDLDSFNKKTSRNMNEEALRVLHSNGVDCYAAIITSPDWTEADFKMAGDKMLQLGLKFINLQPLTPLKGVGFSIPDSGLVISRDEYPLWDLAHVAIQPEHMTVGQYYRNILKLYDRITFNPKTVIRLMFSQPLYMQWRLAKGLYNVRKQYIRMINEFSHA